MRPTMTKTASTDRKPSMDEVVKMRDAASDAETTTTSTRHPSAGGIANRTKSVGHARRQSMQQRRAALGRRTTGLADFWLDGVSTALPDPGLHGLQVLVVDAEDTFTAMIAHQLRSLGLVVNVRSRAWTQNTQPAGTRPVRPSGVGSGIGVAASAKGPAPPSSAAENVMAMGATLRWSAALSRSAICCPSMVAPRVAVVVARTLPRIYIRDCMYIAPCGPDAG